MPAYLEVDHDVVRVGHGGHADREGAQVLRRVHVHHGVAQIDLREADRLRDERNSGL